MKKVKTSEIFVNPEDAGKILEDSSCLILEKAVLKKVVCRRAGYYVDCRNCNIPLLYPDVARRALTEKMI